MADNKEGDSSADGDGQSISAEDQEVLDMICESITQRPHLAFTLVDWLIPKLTFGPTKCIAGRESKRFTGKIGSINAKGFCFVLSPEAKETFGTDVFLHSAQRGHFQVGEDVNFAVLLNRDARPQAFDLTSIGSSNDWQNQKGGSKGGIIPQVAVAPPTSHIIQRPVPVQPKPPQPVYISPATVGPTGDRHTGTVVSFMPDKNFGFIQCPEVFAQYGKDIWVHGEQMQSFSVGDTVAFTLILNKNGAPQAIDLEAPRVAGSRAGGGKRPPVAEPAAGDRYTGSIINIYPQKNFGFIKCEDTFAVYGKDLWVHAAQLQSFGVNDTVSFSLILNKNGQPQAIDLEPVGGKAKWARQA